MRADLELLEPNSNLPPFDIKVPTGQDPDELAREIAAGGRRKRRADLELLDPDTPKEVVKTPTPAEPPINVEAYDPIALFGKLMPGVAEEAAKREAIKREAVPMRRSLRKKEVDIDEAWKGAPSMSMQVTSTIKGGIRTTTYPGKSNVPEGYEEFLEPVQSISRSDDKPNFIERGIDALTGLFGVENVRGLSEGAKAQALVMHMAKEEGIPLDKYRQSPEFVEKAASSFISMSTLGLAPAIKKGLIGEVEFPATDTPGYVGEALGSLAGLYTAPIMIAGKLVKPVLNFLPKAFQNEAVASRIFKSALRDSVLLGPALGLSATGEALEQVTFTQAAGKIWEGTKSGAMIGTIFGASRGMFPKEGWDTGARILTGLVGLNAYRAAEVGGNPFTDRPMGDVLFDIALDTFFLYKGLPKNMRFEVAQDLTDLNTRIDKAKTPPSPAEGEQIPSEVLQQAQVKVAEVEKVQIELEAKRIEEKAKAAIEAKAELEVKGQEVKDIKEGKEPEIKVEELDPDLRAILEEGDKIEAAPRADLEIIEPKAKLKAKVKVKRVEGKAIDVVPALQEKIQSDYPNVPFKFSAIYYPDGTQGISLDTIKIPKDLRRQGEGTKILNQIRQVADQNNLRIETSPVVDATGFFDRQTDFVKREDGRYIREPKAKLKAKKKFLPITDLDLQTGTPEPEALKQDNHPFRNSDVEHTNNLKKLMQDKIDKIDATPEVFTRYLINEANRYLNGEDVPIDKVRNGLSELATRADNLETKFDKTVDFRAWKDTVREAAKWARQSDRLTIKRTEAKLTMGVDPIELAKYVKDFYHTTFDKLKPFQQKDVYGHFRVQEELKNKVYSPVEKLENELERIENRLEKENNADKPNDELIAKLEKQLDEVQDRIDKTGGGTTFNMGVDPTQIKDIFKLSKDQWGKMLADVRGDYQLHPKNIMKDKDLPKLIDLITALSDKPVMPGSWTYKKRQSLRQTVYETALDLGIDIGSIELRRGAKLNRAFLEGWQTFLKSKDMVSGSADWELKRRDVKSRLAAARTGGGIQLNMMIPISEAPQMVKDLLKKIKVGTRNIGTEKNPYYVDDLYRNREVFEETGYWLAKDGKWRYEIGPEDIKPLSQSTIDHVNKGNISHGYLPAYIGDSKLLKAIPELREVKVDINKESKKKSENGYYDDKTRTIHISGDWQDTFVHETQHAVNEIMKSRFRGTSPEAENAKILDAFLKELKSRAKTPELKRELENIDIAFNMGMKAKSVSDIINGLQTRAAEEMSSLKDTVDKYITKSGTESYLKDPGEMESRLSEWRRKMTPEQRKAEPPWETLDRMLEAEDVNGLKSAVSYITGKTKTHPSGLSLYMGLDPTEATKKIVEGAKALAAYTAKARGMKAFKPGEAIERTKEELTRSFVDRSGNIRRELLDQLGNDGYEIIQKMYLSKGASSLAAQQLKQMRGEVYDGLSKNEKRILDNLILADRMLDIGKYKTTKQFSFPEGLTPVEAASYKELFQYTEKLSPERAEILNQRAGAYFDWMKKPLKDMLDAELISSEEHDALASHNYRRIKLVDVFDKRYQSKIGKRTRTVYDSGVESLAHGRDTDIFEPSSEVMALEVFNRAYGRILNNAANKNLLDLARTQPDNPFVAVKEKPEDRIPSGWDRIFVYEKGERKAIYLSPEMAREWITNNPEMSYKLSQFLRYASGSPVLRTFATGIDWGFALANLPRDVMHTWYTAREFDGKAWRSTYSPNLPMFGLQMARDQAAIFGDAILRKGRYEDYIREGGGMEFLVHQGRLLQRGRHIESGIDKVQDFLGYFGETTEIMTRLAIRERVIRNRANEQGISFEEALKDKKITQEATFAARDYMDFGQGGGITKALDNGIPYLNAAVQGTRGMFRAFKPGSGTALVSTYKLAQFAALVSGLYIANRKLNPETMEALQGNIDMQNNLVIPLGDGFSFLDEKGQTRYPYFKIPIDPGQKFFKTFFEACTDKWLGNPVDVEAVTNSLTQLSPVGISSLPPTAGAVFGYVINKDFWLDEDIWKKTDKPLGWPQSKEEYIPGQTPQAAIDFGALTGMSPERTKFAVEQLITGGSMWSWLVGQGYEKLLGDLPKDKKEMHLAEALSKIPVVKRFIGITNPYSQYAQPVADARAMSTLERWIENRGLDTVVEAYLYKEGTSRKEVIDYITKTAAATKDRDTYDRLKDRFKFQENIKGLPNRSFWLALKGTPDTEARARLFVQRFDRAGEAERAQIQSEIDIVQKAGGVISDEFKIEVGKLRAR